MKRKLLLAACALMLGASPMLAQGWTASEVAAGDFYLYNVGANAYLGNGSSWGTHAALKSSGFVVNVAALSGGKYSIGTNSTYSGKFFTDNGYVDTGSSTNWTFEAVPGLTNTYKLKTDAGKYAYAAAGMYNVEIGSDPGTNKAYWKLVTATNRNDVSGASATNPIELTHKINNSRFDDYTTSGGKNYVKDWTDDVAWGGNTMGTNNDVPTWDNRNPCGEQYNRTFDTYQELTGLSNGVYAVSVQGFYREGGYAAAAPKHNAGTESLNAILYANSAEQPLMSIFEEAGKASGGTTVTQDGISGAFPNKMDAASYFFSADLYWNTVYVQVTDGTLKIGIKKSTVVTSDWTIFDNFRLQYFGNSCTIAEAKLGPSISALEAAVSEAQAYINTNPALSATQIAALQSIVDDNDNDDYAFQTKEAFDAAISNIQTALTTYKAMVTPYVTFTALENSVNAIAAVEYTETTSGSHSTFADVISTQTSAVENATDASTITTAISTLTAAIQTYIAGAEPKNDGESFEITCLLVNPSFDDNTIDGWTRTYDNPNGDWSSIATSYTCNEFWNNTFDFYQDLTGLPNGSYQLSVQAFSRPGGNDVAYPAYVGGTNSVTAELYVNSDASTVGNIYAYNGNTTGAKVTGNDYKCVVEGGTDYWVPNNMEGASLYFADEDVYKTTVAALVEDGNLRIGFRDESYTQHQWTIFDNFRLYYYGSSKLVYYQQYLPQLKAEVADDLANAAYANVIGQVRNDLTTANATAPASETEVAYQTVIDNIKAKQATFKAAKSSYDRFAAAKAEATAISYETTVADPTDATDALSKANTLYSSMLNAKKTEKAQGDKVLGFETGEYAPYTNAEVLAALAAADAITDVAAATTEDLDAAITALSGANWAAANSTDVDAIYNGNFVTVTPGADYPKGWKRTNDWGEMESEIAGTYATAYYNQPGSLQYGNQGVYTMPLVANTWYKLTFAYRSHDALNPNKGMTVSVLNGEDGLAATNFDANASTTEWTVAEQLFQTGAAGDYVLTLTNKGNAWMTGVSLVKATVATIEANGENSTIYDNTQSGDVDVVTLNRPISAAYNTLVVPFAITADEVAAKFGEEAKVYVVDEYESAKDNIKLAAQEEGIEANKPVILKATTAGTSYTFFNKTLVAEEPKTVGSGVQMVGTYDASIYVPKNANAFIISGEYMYYVDSDVIIRNTRAYIQLTGTTTAKSRLSFSVDCDDATGIDAVEGGNAADNGAIYNLSGQRVGKDYNGIVIKNGKKVMMR